MFEQSEGLNTQGIKYLRSGDYKNAINYFIEAVKIDGNLNAAYNPGYCAFHGYGVPKDYKKALDMLYIFTDLSGTVANNARYLMGVIFCNGGYGISPDKETAKMYFTKAAQNGHAWATLEFARMLQLEGEYPHARQLLQKATELGKDDPALPKEAKRLIKWNRIMRFC